jgi:hypothetical protein
MALAPQVRYADSPLLLAQFPPTGDSAVVRFDAESIVLFTCLGAIPSLFWSDDLGTSFSSVSLLDFNAGLPQCAILPDAAFSPPLWNVLSVSIGRAGYTTVADLVHVLYPTVTAADAGNRQDAVLANVRITRGAQNTVTFLMIQQLVGDSGASVYRPHLIDADRWDYQPDETAGDANVALVDWYEVIPPSCRHGFRHGSDALPRRGGARWRRRIRAVRPRGRRGRREAVDAGTAHQRG